MKRILQGAAAVVALILVGLVGLWVIFGEGQKPVRGELTGPALPAESIAARRAARTEAAGEARASTEILFGDFHVHTTFSADAFMGALPLLGGEGVHPPADACDYARYCSQLDLFALTDHAEMLTPRMWAETRQAVRDCNAQDTSDDPDLFAFTGFEWSQVGITPEEHYGHKNVIFRHTDDEHLPTRAIGSVGLASSAMNNPGNIGAMLMQPVYDFSERQVYLDFGTFMIENARLDSCPDGVASPDITGECKESAPTPADLFRKLDEWGFDAQVIPHGTTWGYYTPPGYTWDKQLDPDNDHERQRLFEIYSGHGNSEEFNDLQHVITNDDGTYSCPVPIEGFEPCCHRAGVLIMERCTEAGQSAEECERRAAEARHNYANAGSAGHATVPGADVTDWNNCGQCTDCWQPAFNSRPRSSAQYALARGHFEEGEDPRHVTWGFIGSSDNHTARAGTGYKDYARLKNTDAGGFIDEERRDELFGFPPDPVAQSRPRESFDELPPMALFDLERQASFFTTGGLVAVHARERARDGIWEALEARRTYATSGDRILLWFDMVQGEETHAMGSAVSVGTAPRFRVRAVGAFEQQPGCPPDRISAIGEARIERLCLGECYNPGDARRRIERIEVIRIRPQLSDDEPIASLIDDVWRTIPCPAEGACEVEFEDPDFVAGERDALYYVRAIQEATPGINAGGLRCDENDQNCVPCYDDLRTPRDDDCLADQNERAWSSPIYVSFDASLDPPPEPEAPAEGEAW